MYTSVNQHWKYYRPFAKIFIKIKQNKKSVWSSIAVITLDGNKVTPTKLILT